MAHAGCWPFQFKNPRGNQELDTDARPQRTAPRPALPGERGFVLLSQRWAALQHITADPDRAEITRAALVLTPFEHKYISWNSVRSPQ